MSTSLGRPSHNNSVSNARRETFDERSALIETEKKPSSVSQHPSKGQATLIPIGKSSDDIQDEEDEFALSRLENDPELLSLAKNSIFSLDTIAEVRKRRGYEAARQFFHGRGAVLFQILVFSIAVIVGSCHPLVYEWALWNAETRKKSMSFVPGTLYVSYYALSLLVGNVLSYICYGKQQWKNCWNGRALFYVFPSSATLATVETLDVFSLSQIASSTRGVIGQLRLPMVALIGICVLKRYQTAVQWSFLIGVTLSVSGFSFAKSGGGFDSSETEGMLLCLLQAVIAACGSTISELTFKRLKFPFSVQIAQARVLSLVSSSAILVAYCWSNACFHKLFFQGWDQRTVYLIVWLVIRDWSQTFMLKSLSALWKSVASALSVILLYAIQLMTGEQSLNPILLVFTLSVVTEIVGYTLTKRDAARAAREALNNKENTLKPV